MRLRSVFLIFALGFSSIHASGIALDASLGAISPRSSLTDANLDFAGHLWYKFDQMLFLGVGSGIQTMGSDRHFPLLGSLELRLPFGGQVLPIATGDIGANIGDDPQYVWRAGGGFDIKNGDRTSILLLAGYQSFHKLGGHIYARAGLLLEF